MRGLEHAPVMPKCSHEFAGNLPASRTRLSVILPGFEKRLSVTGHTPALLHQVEVPGAYVSMQPVPTRAFLVEGAE